MSVIWRQVDESMAVAERGSYSAWHQCPSSPQLYPPCYLSRVIAVSSGKGGVGKTNLAVNLGLALARRGLRVALLDADLGTANVDVVLGIRPRYHLQHVVTGERTLSEIVVPGPFGLRVVPGASGLPDLVDLPDAQRQALLRSLLTLDGAVDLLLIDTQAGVGQNVIQFILAARELLLVTTPEPTAMTDAYALLKILSNYNTPIATRLVVNCVRNRGEGEATARRLASAAQQFLGTEIRLAGQLPFDASMMEAVRAQSPLVQSHPRSPAAQAIERLAETLWTDAPVDTPASGVAQFFKLVLSFGRLATGSPDVCVP
jgi:flagellar biosynthesis protein FlhG